MIALFLSQGARVILADLPIKNSAALASLQSLEEEERSRSVFAGVDVR
jgi:hypothetical protein